MLPLFDSVPANGKCVYLLAIRMPGIGLVSASLPADAGLLRSPLWSQAFAHGFHGALPHPVAPLRSFKQEASA